MQRMFKKLSDTFSQSLRQLRGVGRLTEENIKHTLKEVRYALIDADVSLSVVENFITKIQDDVIGTEILGNVRPGDALVKRIQDALTEILGIEQAEIQLKSQKPAVILLAGLQGAGKTTTAAKVAYWLQEKQGKSVMLASADVYRPAAIEQLRTLAAKISTPFFEPEKKQKVVDIVKSAIKNAKIEQKDVLILDTAGRIDLDQPMMQELQAIAKESNPVETLLVVDSMMGQEAANIARSFTDTLPITGIILTKTDSDTRGGAALSTKMIANCPIKLIGTGEKLEQLSPFHPERAASQILGMGDIAGLVEEAEHRVAQKQVLKAKKSKKKTSRKQGFDLTDMLENIQKMQSGDGIEGLLSKLPTMGKLKQAAANFVDPKIIKRMEAALLSMTLQERRFPALLNGSRKRRIAQGSGTTIPEVNRLLKQHQQMQKTMKRFSGKKGLPKNLGNLSGQQLPPELANYLDNKK